MDNLYIYLLIGFVIIMNVFLVFLIKKKAPKQAVKVSNPTREIMEKVVEQHAKTEVLGQGSRSVRPTAVSTNQTAMLGSIGNLSSAEKQALKNSVSAVAETVILHEAHEQETVSSKTKAYGILHYKSKDKNVELALSKETTLIGRDPAICDVVLENDSYVSRNHALLYKKGEKIFLVDLNSGNGSYIDGEQFKGQREINYNTKFKIGKTEMELYSLEG